MSGPRTGVLLVNLGTPASPRVLDVRRYLRQFLSDPDVVEVPRALWLPLLNCVILPRRAPRSAELYAGVWTEAGSPLLVTCERQRDLLAVELGSRAEVRLGMRYGEPSLQSAVDALVTRGCTTILLFSLFPQYSATTLGSVCKSLSRSFERMASPPALRVVPPYYAHREYIDAVATRMRETMGAERPDHFVFSYHGLPEAYVQRGDPYASQCEATSRLVAANIGLERADWTLMYQSRFGYAPWLQPYAEELVPRLASTHRRVLVTAPGFTADCLETIDDLQSRLRSVFLSAGGRDLAVVPALNDHPRWIDAIASLVRANVE